MCIPFHASKAPARLLSRESGAAIGGSDQFDEGQLPEEVGLVIQELIASTVSPSEPGGVWQPVVTDRRRVLQKCWQRGLLRVDRRPSVTRHARRCRNKACLCDGIAQERRCACGTSEIDLSALEAV